MTYKPNEIAKIYAQPFGSYRPGKNARQLIKLAARFRGNILGGLFKFLAKSYLRKSKDLSDIIYRGMRLRLLPGENTCDMNIVLYGDHPEEDEFVEFEEAINGKKVFVDIGANIGLYSLIASHRLEQGGRVIAFEPDPRTSEKLRRNLAFNTAENVTLVQKALGDAPCTMHLHMVSDRNAGRNSLRDDLGQKGDAVTVDVATLTSELSLQEIDEIDVLKIDVEGFEDRALMPFFDSAPRALWPKYIMIEILYQAKWSRDILSELHAMGYQTAFSNSANIHLKLE